MLCLFQRYALNWKSSSQASKVLFILHLCFKTHLSEPCALPELKLRWGGGTTGEKCDALGCRTSAASEGLLIGCWNEMRQTFQQGCLLRCRWKQRTGLRRWALLFPTVKDQFLIYTSDPYRAFKLTQQPACWPLTSANSIWRPCHRDRWTCRSLLPMAAKRRCWRKRGAFASWQTNIACSLTKLATSTRR